MRIEVPAGSIPEFDQYLGRGLLLMGDRRSTRNVVIGRCNSQWASRWQRLWEVGCRRGTERSVV